MSTIYVVMGTSGEYSDRTEWPVIAYVREDAAMQHVERATKRAADLCATVPDDYQKRSEHFKQNEFDPGMQNDDETRYYYMTVELSENQ